MKFQARLDLDLTQDDILEQKVQEAVKAYAKNVARQAMHDEIEEEIQRVVCSVVSINLLMETLVFLKKIIK